MCHCFNGNGNDLIQMIITDFCDYSIAFNSGQCQQFIVLRTIAKHRKATLLTESFQNGNDEERKCLCENRMGVGIKRQKYRFMQMGLKSR